MKKKVLALLLAASMVIGLTACTSSGSKADSSRATGEGTAAGSKGGADSLTIWAWDESFNIAAANEAKAIYQAENPDVEINVVTMAQNDIVAKLNMSLSSGAYDGLPDIVLVEDYKIQGYLTSYEEEFADLSDLVKEEDFAAFKSEICQFNGKMYGVPFDSGVAATFYRTDYIEQAGYTKEDMDNLTWDKYIEIGKAVKERCGVDMCTLDPSEISQIRMMMQSAGVWYTDADGKVTFDGNQGLIDAINTYKKLTDAGITKQIAGWDPFVGAFNKGEVASVVTGCWIAPSIQNAVEQSGNWAVAPFPKMAENSASINASSLGGSGWYVLKNAGHEETAKDFLSKTFAYNLDLVDILAEKITLVSTSKTAKDAPNYSKANDFFGGQELFKDFAAWSQEVPYVNYGLHSYALESLMTEVVQAVMSGKDINTTLADFQKQAEAAVAQ